MRPSPEGFSHIAPVLSGRVIALPETRENAVLAGLLERRGAHVISCPLVAIMDAPDAAPIESWLRNFIEHPPACFIILTGEGVRRLFGFAERAGLAGRFVDALRQTRLIARGPKPGRALRDHDVCVDIQAATPTTDGVIETLAGLDLVGREVAVQLYGDNPNLPLMEALAGQGARVSVVAPYRYAPRIQYHQVLALIDALAAGRADAMVFTSKAQIQRLFRVAEEHQRGEELVKVLNGCVVAAVGPVVLQELASRGVTAEVMPEGRYFMKPLVSALAERLTVHEDPSAL